MSKLTIEQKKDFIRSITEAEFAIKYAEDVAKQYGVKLSISNEKGEKIDFEKMIIHFNWNE